MCVVIVVCFAFIFGSKLAKIECNKCSKSSALLPNFSAVVLQHQILRYVVIFGVSSLCTLLQLQPCMCMGGKGSWTGSAAVPTADTSLLTWFLFYIWLCSLFAKKFVFAAGLANIFASFLTRPKRKRLSQLSAAHTHTHTFTLAHPLAGRCQTRIKAESSGLRLMEKQEFLLGN